MKSNLPTLAEIAGHFLNGNVNALTKEQQLRQKQLRAQAPQGQGGILLPWYDREERAMSATGTTTTSLDQGGQTIGSAPLEIGQALRDNLVLEKLGARIIAGLQGNVPLSAFKPGITAAWYTETATASQGAPLVATPILSPKRVNAFVDVSDQLDLQQPLIAAGVLNDLMAALAVAIQIAVVNGSGASGQPLGILGTTGIGSVVGGTNGAAPTGANILDLENAVTGTAKADRGHVGWLVSPYTRRKLRQTSIIAGQGWPIWDNTKAYELLGYPAGVTPSVPDNLTKGTAVGICSAIICGEFSELFIGLFGPGVFVEVLRDKDLAGQNLRRYSATCYLDTAVRSPAAFAAMKDALSA